MSVGETLDQLDFLAGAAAGSVLACEAYWPKDARISWREAWDTACARFPDWHEHGGHEARVAFLEGMVAALRTEDGCSS